MTGAVVTAGQPCVNVSFYGRRCVLTAHGWQQPCRFDQATADDDHGLAYDLVDGSTLKDLLEALSAGGRVAICAAMRWVEYRMYRRAEDARELFGADHMLTQDRRSAVELVRSERDTVMRYLDQRPTAPAREVSG